MDELREAFDDAWDGVEPGDTDDEVLETVETVETEGTIESGNDSDPNDPVDTTENASDTKPDIETEDKDKTLLKGDKSGGTKEPEQSSSAKNEKPPASWNAKAREDWGKIPGAARAQIEKREREVSQVLQQSAEARKAMQHLNSVIGPHVEGLKASGATDPMSAIGNLLSVESSLRVGSQQQKAEQVANIISQYGIDIRTLDSLLAGQPAPNPETSHIEQLLEQRLAPVNDFLAQQQQAQQYQQIQEKQAAQQSVEKFRQQAEFLDDVRGDMADLMDLATKRGQSMSLEDAYTKACSIHPEVSRVLADRNKQSQLMGTQQTIQQKRAAASSLTGAAGGSGGKATDLSLRDQLADVWNSQG